MILETERLRLRRLTADDRTALCAMLQDAEVMYAYAHAFDDAEVDDWLRRQLDRYARYGFGLWAVLRKETGALIGQCGVTMQETGEGRSPRSAICCARTAGTAATRPRRPPPAAITRLRRWALTACGRSSAKTICRRSGSRGGWEWFHAAGWSSIITASICRTSCSPSAAGRKTPGRAESE